MLQVKVRFPLGVYHARSASDEFEWPPSSVRLVGALLAAAHGRPGADPAVDRILLQRLCEAPAPLVIAPDSVAVGEPLCADEAVRLRGATRWAPRNYATKSISPYNVGRNRAEVSKAGVAIGDRPVSFVWPDLSLEKEELERLAILANDVTFLGTTRSPAIVELESKARNAAGDGLNTWTPATSGDHAGLSVTIRVPDTQTIARFDVRQQARHSSGDGVEKAGMVPQTAIGTPVSYISGRRRRSIATAFDPRWWGEMIVLEIDRERSELIPKAPAAYLFARALRVTLLDAFGEVGTATEAPPIIRGRGAEPHCAIVPLPHVWGDHADGLIRGVALLPPHEGREPDVYAQWRQLELGLLRCVAPELKPAQRHVNVPGAGKIRLKQPDASSARLIGLRAGPYLGPARSWVSLTPIVHSRWHKGGVDGLLDQVSADCAHVGLPAPAEIEILSGAGLRGGADQLLSLEEIPKNWHGPLQGPSSHLRIVFPEPVWGPVLIGRARHFGVGLCVPDVPQLSREAA